MSKKNDRVIDDENCDNFNFPLKGDIGIRFLVKRLWAQSDGFRKKRKWFRNAINSLNNEVGSLLEIVGDLQFQVAAKDEMIAALNATIKERDSWHSESVNKHVEKWPPYDRVTKVYPDALPVVTDGVWEIYAAPGGMPISNTFTLPELAWQSAAEMIESGQRPTPRARESMRTEASEALKAERIISEDERFVRSVYPEAEVYTESTWPYGIRTSWGNFVGGKTPDFAWKVAADSIKNSPVSHGLEVEQDGDGEGGLIEEFRLNGKKIGDRRVELKKAEETCEEYWDKRLMNDESEDESEDNESESEPPESIPPDLDVELNRSFVRRTYPNACCFGSNGGTDFRVWSEREGELEAGGSNTVLSDWCDSSETAWANAAEFVVRWQREQEQNQTEHEDGDIDVKSVKSRVFEVYPNAFCSRSVKNGLACSSATEYAIYDCVNGYFGDALSDTKASECDAWNDALDRIIGQE